MMNDKNHLRQKLKQIRENISFARRQEAEKKLLEQLYPVLMTYTYVLSFASFKSEINLWPLNGILCESKKLLLPRVEEEGLTMYHVESLQTLIPSHMGILEPDPKKSTKCLLQHIQCALIPGLGFDLYHHRLGYGQGHFDKLLSKLAKTETIGVGFQEQLVKEGIPTEKHDQVLRQIKLF